ncbi:hypothetical protein B0F90DRAFT_1764229 [Multifurca ochricompacta]|uniref:Uncharacterized protein n=1 Tax=Multifurca ochricompacta TaxID=376703 RepID=A0AAD4QJY4_9AGAM|nr:hypothetical protein B0F90DRAFT_1764229 [Multifurca ochricompacta]
MVPNSISAPPSTHRQRKRRDFLSFHLIKFFVICCFYMLLQLVIEYPDLNTLLPNLCYMVKW